MACHPTPALLRLISKISRCQESKGYRPMKSEVQGGVQLLLGFAEQDSCEEYTKNLMRGIGARYLGSGSFRSAYEFRDGDQRCVIRFPHNASVREHNLEEAKAWKHAGKEYRHLLLPVDDHAKDGSWSVSPKAQVKEVPEQTRAMIGAMIDTDLETMNLHAPDLHTGNVGLYKGKPVAIDYGFGVQKYVDYGGFDLRPGMRKR